KHQLSVGKPHNLEAKSRIQTQLSFILQTNEGSQVHMAERFTGSRNYKRSCVYCRSIGVTTNSGRTVETQWKCEQCAVALCIGKRNCFTLFHENLTKNSQE
uniref:PiggyBac transposable element-derived protein 4 C-terminal zinc-ribbon domain-containing protein n=1 Tax=Magallana gigas TaxID=29159 RepID=A0A8W8N2U3_MAGGI